MVASSNTHPSSAQPSNSSDNSQVSALPAINLPRGGGAIRGIDQKFTANAATGTGSFSIPIFTGPGRSRLTPQLALSYESGSGSGVFGFGWSLPQPAITRKTDKGLPRYLDADESDVFILSDMEDLVPVIKPDGRRDVDTVTAVGYLIERYRPRIEGQFARIERWTHRSGDVHWRALSRENLLTIYGKDSSSRIADPANPQRIFSWLICETRDDRGNAIIYDYAPENSVGVDVRQVHEKNRTDVSRSANRFLKVIRYGNRVPLLDPQGKRPRFLTQAQIDGAGWLFSVVFDYDEHHYEEIEPDAALLESEQHQYVRAVDVRLETPVWSVRPDPFSAHRASFEVRTYRRCRRVLMFHHFAELGNEPCLVRSTEFTYGDFDDTVPTPIEAELAHEGSTRFASFIRSVTQSGFVRDNAQAVVVRDGRRYVTYLKKSMPPVEFEYSKARIQDEIREVDMDELTNLPIGLDGSTYQWVDLDGEGISGILTEQGGAWLYKRNLGEGHFGPQQVISRMPSLANLAAGQQLIDLAADGQLDLVMLKTSAPGFYERTIDESWERFVAFEHLPAIWWDNPNLRFVDLTGDGHADVLITEDEVFTWYPSLAEDGFGDALKIFHTLDEERAPRLIFGDVTEFIYLADMCGDGLSDIVRIRNGDVCYWPHLGYGHFGAKVSMDNAPMFDHPDQFSQKRIRLADIDGTGSNDVIYLGRDGARLYFNQSGNSLSEPRYLRAFPAIDNLSTVMAVDLLGQGTACLVWSSSLPDARQSPMRYIDLMGGQKPHLLIKSSNNLGAETVIEYASSTKFYLQDKREGRHWITKLPFPVHVVERVTTYDRVSRNRFVTLYAYHHGYFDGIEREFRGFGMVEQWDTEEFAALSVDPRFPDAENFENASHVPPIHTKTWFHPGVYLDRDHISDFFAGFLNERDRGEYYREPAWQDDDVETRRCLLDDTILPSGLTVEEEREACRALKGKMLHQEVYAHDGTDKAQHPYTVIEQNFSIVRLQPRDSDQHHNRHAVFFTHPREALTYNYERNPADPRLTHTLTLEVDPFGNVLQAATVAYGRRQSDMTLPAADRAKQTDNFITYTENRFTNSVQQDDGYRTPLVSEMRTFEITGLDLLAGNDRFTLAQMLTAGVDASTLDYEDSTTQDVLEKRLIEHVRTLYRRNNLTGALPLDQLESLALPFEIYKLAFTAGLLTQIYGVRLNGIALGTEDGYVHSEADTHWWIPSGQVFYSPTSNHTPALELAYARQHFFLAHRYRDPFFTQAVSTEKFVSYDHYDLLVRETRDILDNLVTVGERDALGGLTVDGNDYRVLQPTLVMDANGNRSAVVFDALGMIVGTAVMGKPPPAAVEGDSLANFTADLIDAVILDHLDDPLANPQAILQRASSRLVYDLFAYQRTRNQEQPQPAVIYTLVRETHDSAGVPAGGLKIRHSFSYSDGFGREIQMKIQAEPGRAPRRDAEGQIIVRADGQPEMTANDVNPRWVGSGWVVYNNKGKPVRKYEPFFTDTHRFEFGVRIGISIVIFYDPLERVVGTLYPNHTWDKVVFDAWSQTTWDVSDTIRIDDPKTDVDVGGLFQRLPDAEYLPRWYEQREGGALGQEEQTAAEKTAVHANTPSVAYADSLGRAFLTVAHNRFKYSDTPPADPPLEEFHRTRVVFDIEGNQRDVIDERRQQNGVLQQRVVMLYDYDMLGNRIHQTSMEAGERWTLNDAANNPLYAWDSLAHRLHMRYDRRRRLSETLLRSGAGAEIRVGQNTYGESRLNPETANLREKLLELRDQAGIVTTDDYDFKGNLLHSQRQLAQTYNAALNWLIPIAMEAPIYHSRTSYDALNRATELTTPDNTIVRPTYNEANLLERLEANLRGAQQAGQRVWTPFVLDIDYDAKGQRTLIEYGSDAAQNVRGVTTTYEYDPLTFRLVHLLTQRNVVNFPNDCQQSPPNGWPGCEVQSLHYTYDPQGNITHIRDDAQQIIYFRNRRVEPSSEYTYDALYRLIEATGRERLALVGAAHTPHSYNDSPRTGIAFAANDGNAMGRYLERYRYDEAGNFREMIHRSTDLANPGWTRTYDYSEISQLEANRRSNRLTSTTIGALTETYSAGGDGYDAHGNMLRMPQLQVMQWDYLDQLQMSQRQAVNAVDADGTQRHGERTWYVYDSSGQRVRKVTELATGQVKDQRIYLGTFEIYRTGGAAPLVRETLHIMDDIQRIALVETRTQGNEAGIPAQLIRYQFGNHLGSASLELDEQAQIISYEEYTPYGSTSVQAGRNALEVNRKRYRYIGMERDEESGLSYHTARYYIPWLGRWTSCDPKGHVDSFNLYQYALNNPIRLIDTDGSQSSPPKTQQQETFSEFPPLVVKNPNPNTDVSIGFEEKNLAKGTARFTGAKHINNNLAVKPNLIPGSPGDLIVHGNVEVHLKVNGKEVPMTQRYVRYWALTPEPDVTVAKGTGTWNVKTPDTNGFVVDAPTSKDAPGWQIIKPERTSVGQTQEFIAGNPKAGGVYYQTLTLTDPDGTSRVIHSEPKILTPDEYREVLKQIKDPKYAKTHDSKFLFDVKFPGSDTGVLTPPNAKKPGQSAGGNDAQQPKGDDQNMRLENPYRK